MYDIEDTVTKCWASMFIDTKGRSNLLYEDIITIYCTMFNIEPPEEPVQDVIEYLVTEFSTKVKLPDCTLRSEDYLIKILIYLSCNECCPTQEENVNRMVLFPPDVQAFLAEVIQQMQGLISGHTGLTQDPDTEEPVEPDIIKKLEESFSNTPEPCNNDESIWKTKYGMLHRQHISDETEIQELMDRLEQSYRDNTHLREELAHLQAQVSERNSLVLQLEDYKSANTDLIDQLDRTEKNVSKLRIKVESAKKMDAVEARLNEKEVENTKLRKEIEEIQIVNTQNQHDRQALRKEVQAKRKLEIESDTLQKINAQLRLDMESARQQFESCSERCTVRDSTNTSLTAAISLADELKMAEDEDPQVVILKEQLADMTDYVEIKLKLSNFKIDEQILQDQITAQVQELTKDSNKILDLEYRLKTKSDDVERLKLKYARLKSDSEERFEELTHDNRQEIANVKANLNEALFISKKESLDKDTIIKQLERKLASFTSSSTEQRKACPSPSTPVFLRRYRSRDASRSRDTCRTPSAIPRLITPIKPRSHTKEFNEERLEEINKLNQAAAPHLRSTYPLEVQYHNKPVILDCTGRITTTPSVIRPTQKATAFEIPQPTPKAARKKRAVEKRKENVGTLLQFSPPKSKKRRK